jgi:uracil-DNA glycosylase|tara:strand:+ start:6683 stop:7393 length:711 start_codon:yes stop_codon:yes gene_type:complete
MNISNLSPSNIWGTYLVDEFKKDYILKLESFLTKEYDSKKSIYPDKSEIFSSFNLTPLNKVKVVIIGQDPYHGKNQAHGLCFSVKPNVRIPPSLKNIYKELKSDLNLEESNHGFLESWAKNGVLMLNSVLTVEHCIPASHKGRGWEILTDKVVDILNDECKNLVFLLWGSHAQKKAMNVDRNKHLVLESSHPSPLSAYRGFLGCKHFSKANNYLINHNIKPIDWFLQPTLHLNTTN